MTPKKALELPSSADLRSVEGWWEARKAIGLRPEFVEWVEEQRSKAA